MCGIFGLFGREVERVCEVKNVLMHRGPDAFGVYWNKKEQIYLSHNRLSIIDLSDAGKQPMCNEDGTIWLTYNGEIYNFGELRDDLLSCGHKFHSNTDSEVVLHAYEEWGEGCLSRFNGMFAFGLWDSKKQKILIARDRLGIKPCYYTLLPEGFCFASEPKAILCQSFYKKEICYSALFSFLIYRYIPGENSVWKGIYKIPPGHFGLFDCKKGSFKIKRYWEISLKQRNWDEAEALEYFEELFDSAVSYRLKSDVPLGVFLSGGLDSTAITFCASRQVSSLKTFCIGFEGMNSEIPDALKVARHFKTNHFEDRISITNIHELLDKLFNYFDEPLGDSSILPTYLLCRQARKNVIVALSGDGGDELFGGYNWYIQFQRLWLYAKILSLLSPFHKMFPNNNILSQSIRGSDPHGLSLYRMLTSPRFDLPEIKGLFPYVSGEEFPDSENELYREHFKPELGKFKRWQYIDLVTFLTDDILTKVDRASMAHSLEVRVPFLDHRLVEFAFSLQDSLCISKRKTTKYLIRQFLRGHVPPGILQKKKQGFSCPVLSYWPREEIIHEVDRGYLVRNGIISKSGWENLKGKSNVWQYDAKIWLIGVLERWSKRWLA